jgi:hypothetical protein
VFVVLSLLKWPDPHASRLILFPTRFLFGTFIVTSINPGGLEIDAVITVVPEDAFIDC